MSSDKRFRWIILEDDRGWADLLRRVAPKELSPPLFVRSLRMLRDEIDRRPPHLISMDQNVPEQNEELSPATEDNGLVFLEQLRLARPLVRTAMYTAYGSPKRAHLAGAAGTAEYIEKSHPRASPDALSPPEYIALLNVLLRGGKRPNTTREDAGYIRWALNQAAVCLPPSMARACGAVANAMASDDWAEAGRRLAMLREQVISLAWAHASALCLAFQIPKHTIVPTPFNGIAALERHLFQLWGALDRARRLGEWKGYVTEQDEAGEWRSAGGAVFAETRGMREIRNDSSHFERPFSRADYEAQQAAILALIDALAFWADHPLMNAVRTHPDDRRRLEYLRLAGSEPWRLADVASSAEPRGDMRARRTRVHVLHRDSQGEHLVDLHPFVTMKDVPGRDPIPCLLIPPTAGRQVRWCSLLDYSLLNFPIQESEADILRSQFGPSLRWR